MTKKAAMCLACSLLANIFFAQNFSIVDSPMPQETLDNVATVLRGVSEIIAESQTARIVFRCDEPDVEVYIDRNYIGRTRETRLVIPVSAGRHRVLLRKQGFFDKHFYIDAETGFEKTFSVSMERMLGELRFSVEPADAEIIVDGRRIFGSATSLPSGVYQVTVRRFGYETAIGNVSVEPLVSRMVRLKMQTSVFALSHVAVSPASFNPKNNGAFGKTFFSFRVSAPGSGILKIFDSDGNLVGQHVFRQFTTWNQGCAWTGRLDDKVLPDGKYIFSLSVKDEAGNETTQTCVCTIDSSIEYSLLSVSSGGAAVGNVPAASLFPQKTLIFDFACGPSFSTANPSFRNVPITFAILGTPSSHFEMHGQFGIMPSSSSEVPVFVSASAKIGGKIGRAFLCANLHYGYVSCEAANLFFERAISAGLCAGAKFVGNAVDLSVDYSLANADGVIDDSDLDHRFNWGISWRRQKGGMLAALWCKMGLGEKTEDLSVARRISFGTDLAINISDTASVLNLGFGTMTEMDDEWICQVKIGFDTFIR